MTDSFSSHAPMPGSFSLAEYRDMFDLTELDLRKTVLDCVDGSSSFNSEFTQQGGRVVSCNPLYQFSREEIAEGIATANKPLLANLLAQSSDFEWDYLQSPEHLRAEREQSLVRFLGDYEAGISQSRYVGASLPHLPFESAEFDLALWCPSWQDAREHNDESVLAAVHELTRTAKEVRIYPLMNDPQQWRNTTALVVDAILTRGKQAQLRDVRYRFYPKAHQMLVISN